MLRSGHIRRSSSLTSSLPPKLRPSGQNAAGLKKDLETTARQQSPETKNYVCGNGFSAEEPGNPWRNVLISTEGVGPDICTQIRSLETHVALPAQIDQINQSMFTSINEKQSRSET